MSEFLNHPEFFNEPVSLSESERCNPIKVFQEFFADYRLSELRQILDSVREICLTTDRPPFNDPEQRGNYLLFEKNLIKVWEATWILAKVPVSSKVQ